MDTTGFMIRHYLDACIVVKLVTLEAGHQDIEEFVRKRHNYPCFITEFAFYETLSVLKNKWSRRDKCLEPDQKLSFEQYRCAVSVLEAYVSEGLLQIDSEFRLNNSKIIIELGDLVKSQGIDYSDALQVYTVRFGRWAAQTASIAAPVFVTTDKGLAQASKAQGLRTWWFGKEPHPLALPPSTTDSMKSTCVVD